MSECVFHGKKLSVEQEEDSVVLQLQIPKNLYYFRGHFPDAPVLPGVTLTHWVIEYLEHYFQVDTTKFKALNGLKFQIIVCPDYILNLKLTRINPHKFSFSYSSEHGQHASGKVLFE